MRTLLEKLANVEDQLQAAEGRKEMICGELVSYKDAQNKMSADLAVSKKNITPFCVSKVFLLIM